MFVVRIRDDQKSRSTTLRGLALMGTLLAALAALPAYANAAPVPLQEQDQAQPPEGSQSSNPSSPTITNDHVIRMVKAGVPESAIISSIQSSRGQFDLSPDGLLALHRAGVSQKIMETMMAGGENQSSPNASSITGNAAAPAQAAGAATNLIPQANLAAAKVGVKVKNPRANLANAAVIALLKKQRSAADAEAAQMKAAVRSQSPVGVVGQTQPLAAAGTSQTLLPAVQAPAGVTTNNGQKSVAVAQPQPMLATAASQTLLPAAQSPAAVTTNNGPKPMLSGAAEQTTATPVLSQSPVTTNNGQKSASSAAPQKNRVTVGASPAMQKASTVGAIEPEQASSATGNASLQVNPSPQGGVLGSVNLTPIGAGPSQGGGSGQSQNGGWVGSAGSSGQPQGTNGGGAMSGSGPTGANSAGHLPSYMTNVAPINSTVLTCATNPQFRILSVSGSSSTTTFTPIDQYNLYTIVGCSFGNPGSNDKVYIYGVGSFQGNFTIKFWSDNSIVVSLDESITGVPDMSNITLVVQRNDGQQAQKGGFKFYAVRATVPLSTIPSSWAHLATMTCGFACGGKTMPEQFSSPPTSVYPGPGPSAGTLFVSRFYNGAKFYPTSNSLDWYDFSQLAPGFTTDSFQLTTYPPYCPGVVTYEQSFGTWNEYWGQQVPGDQGDRLENPNNIYVYLSDTTCSGFSSATFFLPFAGTYQNQTSSYYALAVWVNGPSGIDPITGQPGQ